MRLESFCTRSLRFFPDFVGAARGRRRMAVAKAVRFAVERALKAVNFTVLTERAGTDNFLRQAGMRGDTTALFGIVAFWLVILATLIIAFNELGLTYITDLLGRVVLFTPKLLIAMLIVVFGSYCARFVGAAVHTYCVDAKIPDADILGRLVRYVIMTFVVMIALSQVEIGGDMVQRTFLIILGGLCWRWRLPSELAAKTGRRRCCSAGGRNIKRMGISDAVLRPRHVDRRHAVARRRDS